MCKGSWLSKLQASDFDIIHRSEIWHGNADAILGRPWIAKNYKYCDQESIDSIDIQND